MKTVRSLFLMTIALMAPAARSATLSYTSAYRYLESGFAALQPADPFADFDMGISGLNSSAMQRSELGASGVVVASRITGFSERGASFFKITFALNEPAAWSLTGAIELTGSDGFACVSFMDMAHPDAPMVHEIISAPPDASGTRILQYGGVLVAGSYSLEAMIYGGGDHQLTRGGIDAILAIPEPGAPLLLVMVLLSSVRRRR